jgi:squalene-hopene/tetraprenyl-beta-curcumene cyclase
MTDVDLDRAVERAQARMLERQRADGSWNAIADMGPACTAQVTIALRWAGALEEEEARDVRRWLAAQQQDDGSFLPYRYAREGTAGATASAWAALVATGAPNDDPACRRAESFVRAHGDLKGLVDALLGGDLAALYLGMVGLIDPKLLPCPPMAWVLSDRIMDRITRRVHAGVPFAALQMSAIVHALRGDWDRGRSFLQERAVQRLLHQIDVWQNADGSINANSLQTCMTLAALRAIGIGAGDRRFDRAVRSLKSARIRTESGSWFGAFDADVWSTALCARALLFSGVARNDPRLDRAVRYLLACQSDVPQPEVNNRGPRAARIGGWAFQRENVTMVDSDDTGMVLGTLGMFLGAKGRIDPSFQDAVRASIAKGRAWLTGMQNDDGGWSAFVRGLPQRRLGPMMARAPQKPRSISEVIDQLRHPHEALGDPSTEDVTARALFGLAKTGSGRADDPVARGLAFLSRFQDERGAWWGRWVVNYVPSTTYVLSAVGSLGLSNEAWIERASQWVLSCQNADGGWGEWVDSYRDPSRAGRAPSTPPLTSLVLSAFADVGLANSDAAKRAARYLVETQESDGTWSNRNYLAVFVPPDGFYEYPATVAYAPLEALARFRDSQYGLAAPC